MIAAFGFSVLLAAASPAAPPGSVVVLPLGTDPAEAGSLAHELEQKLRDLPGVIVQPGASLAPRGLGADLPGGDIASLQKIAALFDTVETAFSEDHTDVALNSLAQIEALENATPRTRVADRVKLLLWRTAVYAQSSPAAAEAAAHDALVLSPALTIDLKVFPPTVKTVIDRVRAKGLPHVKVTLTTIPTGATILVDDVAARSPFTVAAGKHSLVVAAPGARTVESRLEFSSDSVLTVELPPALSAADRIAAETYLAGVLPDEPTSAALDAIAAHANASSLIVAGSTAGSARARVWRHRPEPVITAANGPLLAQAVAPVFSRRFRGAGAPIAFGGVYVGPASRSHELQGSGASLSTPFAGARIAANAAVPIGAFRAGAEARWTTWSIAHASLALPDGTTGSVAGGETIDLRAFASRRFGPSDDVLSARLGAEFFFQQHSGHDLRGLGLFTSHSWYGPALDASIHAPLGPPRAGAFAIDASLCIRPVSFWTESPGGVTGSSPSAAPSPSARVALSWNRGPRTRLSAGVEGSRVSVGFSGRAVAPFEPPMQGATQTETEIAAFAGAEMSF